MDTKEAPKTGKLLPRLAAVLIVIVGVFFITGNLHALWRIFNKEIKFSFFIAFFIALSFIFAIYLIRLGINVWSNITESIIRQISIFCTFSVWVIAFSQIDESLRSKDNGVIIHAISMAFLGLLYLIINSLLFKLFKTQRTPISPKLKSLFKTYLSLLSLNIIVLPTYYYEKTMEASNKPGHDIISSLVIFPISIIIAIIFYKWCEKRMEKTQQELEYIEAVTATPE